MDNRQQLSSQNYAALQLNTLSGGDKYAALLTHMQQGFCIIDVIFDGEKDVADYRFLEANPVFEMQTGLVNAAGRTMRELQPEHEQHWFDAYAKVVKTGQPIHFEQEAAHLAGGVWYDVFAFPFGPAGSNLVAVLFDAISERKEVERQQAFLLTLSDVLRPLADPVRIEETVTRVGLNEFKADRCYYCRIEGGNAIITRDAIRGDLPSVAGIYPLSSFALLKRVVDLGQPFVVEDAKTTPILDEDIRALCLHLQIMSFIDVPVIKNGQAVGILCIVQSTPRQWTKIEVQLAVETAERTWSAVERARAEEKLRLADRRKDEFLAMLAHELRNPMSTVRSGVAVLKMMQHANSEAATLLAMMDRQVEHLVRMIDDLLDVSRVTQGKIELKMQKLELASLITAAVEAILPRFEASGKQLQIMRLEKGLIVQGDPTRISQIITNLLTNGLRYTNEDGKVEICLKKDDDNAVVVISDNGIGLSAEQQTSIFELFVQADNSLSRGHGGLGIGLTLVKMLSEMHGGRVEVKSPGLGQGSAFSIYMPLSLTSDQDNSNKTVSNSLNKPRILVIDDNDDAAVVLSMLIRIKGYEVEIRDNGKAGIAAAEIIQPAVILCDIGMPGLDGYQTAHLIRQQGWGKNTILIAVSGYGQEEDKQMAKAAGFDGHLTKPVSLDQVLALMEHFKILP